MAPRPLRSRWPYKEVPTWPGVCPPLGAGPGTGRRGRERVGEAAGKESRGRTRGSTGAGGSGGHTSHIFYLLWCDSRHPTLIGPPSPARRPSYEEKKNLHIFPPPGGDCGHTGCCESPLISGLEKTRSDLSSGTAGERRPSGPLGCGWERPTCLRVMAPTPMLRLGVLNLGLCFFNRRLHQKQFSEGQKGSERFS